MKNILPHGIKEKIYAQGQTGHVSKKRFLPFDPKLTVHVIGRAIVIFEALRHEWSTRQLSIRSLQNI